MLMPSMENSGATQAQFKRPFMMPMPTPMTMNNGSMEMIGEGKPSMNVLNSMESEGGEEMNFMI
jgi:hypothetical protein